MISLTALQSRIIGVMLEKESTTPEQYPLSLNALANGCNQKSNREPVMALSETEVQNVVDELIEMKQLMVDSGASGRVNKYKHRFCNTSFGSLQLTEQQKAIVCLLFLRGPQTPGELRTRTNRLADFANVSEVELAIEQLQNINNAPLVKKLPKEPGKREARYIHLFTEHAEETLLASENMEKTASAPTENRDELEGRVMLLEQQVEALKAELAEFKALLS